MFENRGTSSKKLQIFILRTETEQRQSVGNYSYKAFDVKSFWSYCYKPITAILPHVYVMFVVCLFQMVCVMDFAFMVLLFIFILFWFMFVCLLLMVCLILGLFSLCFCVLYVHCKGNFRVVWYGLCLCVWLCACVCVWQRKFNSKAHVK